MSPGSCDPGERPAAPAGGAGGTGRCTWCLAAPAVERDAAASADAADGPAADGGAVGLAPDEGTATAGPGLELDAAVAALAGPGDQRPQPRRAHPRHGLEVIHPDHHPSGRPGFRIHTA